jgi:cellulase
MFGLHNSQILDGSEIFMGCAQLKVTGSGSGTCGPTIEIPGAYKADDKNIFIPNFYEKSKFDMSTYKAPGGEIASCGGSDGGAAPTVPSTPQPATSTVAGAPSPVASPSAIVEATPKAAPKESVDGGEAPASSPIAPSVSAPASAPAAGNDASAGDLPTTSSLDSFMTWLKEKTESTLDTFKTWLQGQETGSKARRHARAF